ncbi:hypothetical protein [Geminocystis sp. GBBB08]|uniref:hypothetical protein n=1 Tax=Geminocystis sp. GBBB08 TaxID=2604140 RepID=UPI0027E35CE2|nr:hypothetical protein [Geminocystis sp. GBBB08]MBL1210630.1 hypothetical protein [Geminocystis sp. GBBB08]
MLNHDIKNNQKSSEVLSNNILGESKQIINNSNYSWLDNVKIPENIGHISKYNNPYSIDYIISKDEYVINCELEIDGEWYSIPDVGFSKTHPISLQIGDRNKKKIFLEHPQWSKENEQYIPTWIGETPLPLLLNGQEIDIITNDYDRDLYESQEKYIRKGVKVNRVILLTLHIFYSFKDIELFLGKRLTRSILGHIEQKRRLRTVVRKNGNLHEDFIDLNYHLKIDGNIYKVKLFIIDYCGIAGGKSLLDTSLTYGIPMEQKTIMDDYKSSMDIPYTNSELRQDFIEYSLGDLVLFELGKNHQIKHNNIRDILELENMDNIPLTKGSEVAKTLQDFILNKCPIDTELLDHLQFKSAEDLLAVNGIKTNLDKDKSTTAIYNGIVHGGRCKNESPQNPVIDGLVLSMDLSGCYASALKSLQYPIGLPLHIFYHKTEKNKLTLRKFLKEFGKELVPDCWHIVVSTSEPLSFMQNLIFSKHFNGNPSIDDTKDEISESHIKGEFGIYLNEIKNGILTHHSLEMLKAIASNSEWGELMDKLEIVSGVVYLKSHQCNSFEEYQEKVLSTQGKIKTVKRKKQAWYIQDDRPLYWYPIPLGEFINPLIVERKKAKNERDLYQKNSDKYNELNSQQETLKLFINAVYGVICSPYFKIGNTTVANNITDMARMGCWAMQIASCGKTAVTDGSEFDINKVLQWTNKFPSFNTLVKLQLELFNDSDRLDKDLQKNFEIIPLGNQGTWDIQIDEKTSEFVLYHDGIEIERKINNESWQTIDDIYTQHMNNFFGKLNLTWLKRYSYEDKGLYDGMVLHSQSNYLLNTLEGKSKIKARGHKTDKKSLKGDVIGKHPLNDMLTRAKKGEKIPFYHPVVTEQLLKLKEVVNAHTAIEQGEKAQLITTNNLLPSDTIHVTKRIYPISASCFYYLNKQQKNYWEKLEERCKKFTNDRQKLDYLFRDEKGYLDYSQAHRLLHTLITINGISRDLELKKLVPKLITLPRL